jgi:hypothetical protein
MSNISKIMNQAAAGAGGGLSVEDVFSTDTYAGTSLARSFSNGLDLSGEGGLVWIKQRTNAARNNTLYDTERGDDNRLFTNSSTAQSAGSDTQLTAFNSDGFSLGTDGGNYGVNYAYSGGGDYVAWSFRVAEGFFDIVTWSGNNASSRTISHNLGAVPGAYTARSYSNSQDWWVYHRNANEDGGGDPEDYALKLHETGGDETTSRWNNTAPTDTTFTVDQDLNFSGRNYIAYLWGHDTSDESLIKCGVYAGSGSSSGNSVNVGWEPQWVLIKCLTNGTDWGIIDNVRGSTQYLRPNLSAVENSPNYLTFSSTGFDLTSNDARVNESGANYIYIAIRAEGA